MKNCFVFKNMRKCTFSLLCLCACIAVLFLVFGGIREIGAESSSPHVNPGDDFQSLKKNTGKRTTVPCFGNIPLYFIPNQGQMDSPALFCAKTPRYTLWLTREGLVFDSMKKVNVKINRDVSRFIFLKANQDPVIVPEQPTTHRVNYFKGSNKSQWYKSVNIPTSRAVRYKSLYKKIDLKVYGHEKQVEYDWIVKPGGNPGDIGFRYRGVKRVSLDETGNLEVRTAFGRWVHQKPRAYQVIDGKRQVVNVVFKKKPGKNTYGFNVGPYHKDYELVIDPLVVVLSSYLGGSGYDGIYAMALDNSKAIYVAGYTLSMDFPTGNGFQDTHAGDYDAFVSKLSPDGEIWCQVNYFPFFLRSVD